MTGRMPPSSQPFTDFTCWQGKTRFQRIQQTGLSNAGIACKGTYLAGNYAGECFKPLPCFRTDLQGRKASIPIELPEFSRLAEIPFVKTNHTLAISVLRHGGKPVNEKRICDWCCAGSNNYKIINVGNSRPMKEVFTG